METKSRKDQSAIWEDLKKDIYRFYIQEDNTLCDTRTEFQHRIQACRRTWQLKMADWGFAKYQKKRKRTKWERETNVQYPNKKNVPHPGGATEGGEFSAPRPYIGEVALNFETESFGAGDMVDPSTSAFLPNSTLSRTGSFENISLTWSISTIGISSKNLAATQEDAPTSMLDQYLNGDEQSWRLDESSLGYHREESRMAKLSSQLSFINAHIRADETVGNTRVFCTRENGFFLPPDAIVDNEIESNSELDALAELFEASVELLQRAATYGEYDEATLECEFALAKLAERHNVFDEAEYRCRKVLRVYPFSNVQAFLGLQLASSSRLNEAICLLFCALAGLIVQAEESSYALRVSLLTSIEPLYAEIVIRSELNFSTLTNHFKQIIIKIQEQDGEHQHHLFRDLFWLGISMAQECRSLDLILPAEDLYRSLVELAPRYMNIYEHGTEIVNALREYGYILRNQRQWQQSALQVLRACEYASKAKLQDPQLVNGLHFECSLVIRALTERLSVDDSLVVDLRRASRKLLLDFHSPAIETALLASPKALSPWSPLLFTALDSFAVNEVSDSELSLRFSEAMQLDNGHSSTWSRSDSNRIGMTYSDDQVSGISDSWLFQ